MHTEPERHAQEEPVLELGAASVLTRGGVEHMVEDRDPLM